MTTYQQFEDKHGRPVPVDRQGNYLSSKRGRDSKDRLVGAPDVATWLFASGARYDSPSEPIHQEQFYEPPTDPEANFRIRRDFAKAELQAVEVSFVELRSALLGSSGEQYRWDEEEFGPAPSDEPGDVHGTAALKHLRRLVLKLREALASLDNDDPVGIALRKQEETRRSEAEETERAVARSQTAEIKRRQLIRDITI